LHDVWLMLLFGVAGYLLRKLGYPLAPAVLAIVLGPLAEQSLRQSLLMSQGEASIFFTRPLSLIFLACAVVLFLYPFLMAWRRRIVQVKAAPEGAE
ncbi:MAG: tripartite tricarboxylate transporter permease, partial [Propylenella sp.]